ncbi:unnamed protein product [Ranitomeya imitator]|uniref:Cysteine protease n=1 Tax=Ranitomeya imitator TaxID=111125 RepID=A0ABN9L256_9NEOB|nr:unnamed protein product [Ranitomeya imitator]
MPLKGIGLCKGCKEKPQRLANSKSIKFRAAPESTNAMTEKDDNEQIRVTDKRNLGCIVLMIISQGSKCTLERICRPADSSGALRMRPPFWKMAAPRKKTDGTPAGSFYACNQAQMGVGEGKYIGQWYGPNTVAQVLRKLAAFDQWSSMAVHIAMDNTVVTDEIRRLCRLGSGDSGPLCNGHDGASNSHRMWRPLVLLIPLRLGLSEINGAYIETLKHCFMLPQSLGVIGGRPNSAHYFIGYVGDELIYLDPHTTQLAVEPTDGIYIADDSFHCQHPPCRMHVSEIDPSIAVGFFCSSEEDFDDWCQRIRKTMLVYATLGYILESQYDYEDTKLKK